MAENMLTEPAIEVRGLRISWAIAGGHSSDGSETVLHANFALQSANFREVVKGIDVANRAAFRDDERGNHHAEGLALSARSPHTNLRVDRGGSNDAATGP